MSNKNKIPHTPDYEWMWKQLKEILEKDELLCHDKKTDRSLYLIRELENDKRN